MRSKNKKIVDIKRHKVSGSSRISSGNSRTDSTTSQRFKYKIERRGNVLSFPQRPPVYQSKNLDNPQFHKYGIAYFSPDVPVYLADFSGNPQELFYLETTADFAKRFLLTVPKELVLCVERSAKVGSGDIILFMGKDNRRDFLIGAMQKDGNTWTIRATDSGKVFNYEDVLFVGQVFGYSPLEMVKPDGLFIGRHSGAPRQARVTG